MITHRTASSAKRRPIGTILLLTLMLPITAAAQQVIVGPSVSQESLSKNGIRAIFFMRMAQWPSDGKPIKVFVLADRNPLHVKFSKNILRVLPHQLRRSWDRATFSGTGQSPIEVSDESEMIRRVSTTPGAIGYVTKVEDNASVRSLAIE